MNILKIILTVIYAIDCIALTVVVLMQEGKQQGLGSIAGVADTWSCKRYHYHGSYFLCTVNRTEHYLICQEQNRSWEHSCCVSMQKNLGWRLLLLISRSVFALIQGHG